MEDDHTPAEPLGSILDITFAPSARGVDVISSVLAGLGVLEAPRQPLAGAEDAAEGREAEPEAVGEGSGAFDVLPDEIVLRVFALLDPRDVAHASQACKRFHQLSADTFYWKEMLRREQWEGGSTKSYYMSRYKSYRRHERERISEEERRRQEERQRRKSRTLAYVLTVLGFSKFFDHLCLLMVFFFLCMCVCKWDRTVDWEWSTIFAPVYVVLYLARPSQSPLPATLTLLRGRRQLIVAPTVYAVLSVTLPVKIAEELENMRKLVRPASARVAVRILENEYGKRRYKVLVGSAYFLVSWLLVFLTLKCAADVNMSWGVTLIPAILLGVWVLCLSVLFEEGIFWDSRWGDYALFSFGGIALTVSLLLVALQLDDRIGISWHYIFGPLYVMEVYAAVLPLLYWLGGSVCCCLARSWCDERTHLGHNPKLGVALVTAAALASLVVLPALSFEVLLAQTLEGIRDYRFATVFTPLFIFASLFITFYVLSTMKR
eukprot:m51a1_g9451 hypothetical protein (490) ;mRNA; r:495700-497485